MIKDGVIFFVAFMVVVLGIHLFIYEMEIESEDLIQTGISGLVGTGIFLFLKRKSAG